MRMSVFSLIVDILVFLATYVCFKDIAQVNYMVGC